MQHKTRQKIYFHLVAPVTKTKILIKITWISKYMLLLLLSCHIITDLHNTSLSCVTLYSALHFVYEWYISWNTKCHQLHFIQFINLKTKWICHFIKKILYFFNLKINYNLHHQTSSSNFRHATVWTNEHISSTSSKQ